MKECKPCLFTLKLPFKNRCHYIWYALSVVVLQSVASFLARSKWRASIVKHVINWWYQPRCTKLFLGINVLGVKYVYICILLFINVNSFFHGFFYLYYFDSVSVKIMTLLLKLLIMYMYLHTKLK